MHKKPFIAVLALGLLLIANAVALAGPYSGEMPVRGFGTGQSKSGLSPTYAANPGSLVSINAGTNRTVPGTFCNGHWQAPFGYTIGGWYLGNEFYASYQDPSNPAWWVGTCTNSPSFDITAINMIARYQSAVPKTFVFQPLVYPALATGCDTDPGSQMPGPVAGGALCAGPGYAITWTASASFLINLPFPIECCQTGPFFAAWYSPTAGALRPGCDDGSLDVDPTPATVSEPGCGVFNEYGAGWDELGKYFTFDLGSGLPGDPDSELVTTLNHILYAEGYTPNDPITHCAPGTCTEEAYWSNDDNNIDAGFGFPTATRDRLGIRLDANGLDTLTSVRFDMNGGATPVDSADLLLEIYAVNNVSGCGNVPTYTDLPLYSQVIPAGTWNIGVGNYTTVALSTPYVWGTLNGGPTQSIALTFGIVPGSGTTTGWLGADPVTGCLPLNSHHSIARYVNLTAWAYIGEVSPQQRELIINPTICREVLPAIEEACSTPGADSWRHYAHDAQQTSASNINVTDPNGAVLRWTKTLPQTSNFTNPTVAGDIVYISSDQQVTAYNLITGALVGTFNGGPEMGSSNRGNTTVAFVTALGRDVVFATGGTLNAITALETNLESSAKIWSFNAVTAPPFGLGGASLGAGQNRFNTSTVLNIAGTDVVFVETEPSAGTGRLWALDAATGALYPGWGVNNPIVLDQAAKHGPSTDGTNLYVGTALITNTGPGSLYSIDAATGAINWQYVEPNGDGWPSGVSVEGAYLYGATKNADGTAHRYKIDKSGAGPVIAWSSAQAGGTYGTPTIGRKFVYYPLDNTSVGVIQVSKDLGLASRNFATSDDICDITLGQVPCIVTLSCDGYLFAGDRNSRWWLMNAVTGQYAWFRDFNAPNVAIVNGTALARASSGADYAVVGIRQMGLVGAVSAYQLNAGSRPRMIQCVEDVVIPVPFGTLGGNPHTEASAILNVGNTDLHISGYSVSDPPPDALASIRRDQRRVGAAQSRVAAQYMNENGYFGPEADKQLTIVGLKSASVDGEFTADQASVINKYNEALSQTSRTRRMAAGASTIRTSNVLFSGAAAPIAIAPGGNVSLDWTWDGTGLLRGQDANIITITHDDPDYQPDGSPTADVSVLYVGGCGDATTYLTWNTLGAANFSKVTNHGAFGDQKASALHIGGDASATLDAALFDGGVLITGDSSAAIAGAELAIDYYDITGYVGNPNPFGNCEFLKDSNLVLGFKKDPPGSCPGTPIAIQGAYVKTYFADSNLLAAGNADPLAAIGVTVDQTEVGAYDPLYGDFKLTRLFVTNRDAVDKVVRVGTYFDWDINANSSENVALASSDWNGYAIWDPTVANARWAYGMLDAHQPSTYGGIDPTAFPPALIMSNLNDTTYVGQGGGYWRGNTYPNDWAYGWWLTNGKYLGPIGCMGGCGTAGVADDRGGFLANELNLTANGTGEVVQVMFAFDVAAPNNTDAFVDASGLDVAKRAARWSGFARGDVNDDGFVSLADVCWLQGGNTIYPDVYCGDVNNSGGVDGADIAQLLSFVSGNAGSQPVGAWRFPW